MKIFVLIIAVIQISISVVYADSKLTLSSLEKQNFNIMTGNEISALFLNNNIKLKDLLSGAIYQIKISENGLIERKVIKGKNPKILTSVEYNSRAALLTDAVDLSIKGNKIITTDGVRTYISILYKKKDLIYGVRDIDHETVNFQIIIEKK